MRVDLDPRQFGTSVNTPLPVVTRKDVSDDTSCQIK